MHLHPFTLLQIRVTDESGKQIWSPMWLIVMGQRRDQLTLLDSWLAYRQRYDLEHFLRFGKQKLLMTAFQTPEVEHEENWVQLTLERLRSTLGSSLLGGQSSSPVGTIFA